MKQMILKSIGALAILSMSTAALAASNNGGARAVGAGLAFASANQALWVNSSTLSEVSGTSLQGLWGFEDNTAAVSLAGSSGQLGWGLGWKDQGSTNRFDGGFGVNLGSFLLGVNMYTNDFNGLEGDASLTILLSKVRLAVAARGLKAGVTEVDVGLGFTMDKLMFGLDIAKSLEDGAVSGYYPIDASLAYNVGSVAVGVGYDFVYYSGIQDGDLHADLSISVANNFAIEGHYRLTPMYDSSIPDFSAGARLMF